MEVLLVNLGIFLILLIGGYIFGSLTEKKHYASIKEKEKELLSVPVVTIKWFSEESRVVNNVRMVYGSVSIAADYFKIIFGGLKSILGGQVSFYETLVDRARREAILRLKQMANNADVVLNLRVETTFINQNSVEVFAYGTAIYFNK